MNIACFLSRFSHHFYAAACVQIHDAALKGNLQIVEALLKGNPNLVSSKHNSGYTPLHLAVLRGRKDMVELLLANKAEVNSKDKIGMTPLQEAAWGGHKEIAELLLANKAEINAKDTSGSTALHQAASSGKKDVVELLLANKAEVDAKDAYGSTALHKAASGGKKDVLELLLANKAEINAKDNCGNTALYYAATYGHKDVAELLLANKAEINAKDKFAIDLPQAAALLSLLPTPLGADVVMSMANPQPISSEVINRITMILEQKLKSLADVSPESHGGIQAIAELIKCMDTKAAAAILEKIKGDNPSLALSIRNLMFVFDDVMLIDDAGMREILQLLDKKCLTIGLKGTREELRNRFFSNMSKRAVEMMKEDLNILGPVKVEDVETCQRQIASVIQKLAESGVIKLNRGRGDEYVN